MTSRCLIASITCLTAWTLCSCTSGAPVRHASVIAPQQAEVTDRIVDQWYANATAHSECRVARAWSITDPHAGPRPQQHFARLRSPVLIIASEPAEVHVQARCELRDEYGGCELSNSVATFSFRSARYFYVRNNEDAKDFPTEFIVEEAADRSRDASNFLKPDRTYAIFASYLDFHRPPHTQAFVVCDLSDPSTLPAILSVSQQ